MNDMTIRRVWLGTAEPRSVTAELDDGSQEPLFSYYSDELSFAPDELVGLTVAQARALHHRRDVAYLQS